MPSLLDNSQDNGAFIMATFPLFEEPHGLFLGLLYHNPFWNLLSQNQSLKKHPPPNSAAGMGIGA